MDITTNKPQRRLSEKEKRLVKAMLNKHMPQQEIHHKINHGRTALVNIARIYEVKSAKRQSAATEDELNEFLNNFDNSLKRMNAPRFMDYFEKFKNVHWVSVIIFILQFSIVAYISLLAYFISYDDMSLYGASIIKKTALDIYENNFFYTIVISVIIAAIGIAASWYFHRESKKNNCCELTYIDKKIHILRGKDSHLSSLNDLKITYKRKRIDKLSMLKLWIENTGLNTLLDKDLDGKSIIIQFNKNILDISSDDDIKTKILSNNRVKISFGRLHSCEGMHINIFYENFGDDLEYELIADGNTKVYLKHQSISLMDLGSVLMSLSLLLFISYFLLEELEETPDINDISSFITFSLLSNLAVWSILDTIKTFYAYVKIKRKEEYIKELLSDDV